MDVDVTQQKINRCEPTCCAKASLNAVRYATIQPTKRRFTMPDNRLSAASKWTPADEQSTVDGREMFQSTFGGMDNSPLRGWVLMGIHG